MRLVFRHHWKVKNEVSHVVKLRLGFTIYGFARVVKSDIDAVVKCDCDGVVVSFPPSDFHLTYKLKITREEYLMRAVEAVEYSKSYGLKVVFSAEDSIKCELSWLKKVFNEVINAGVDVLRVVNTLGCITPIGMRFLIIALKKNFDKPIEVHCHNDHGLALANALAAYESGATRLSTCVLG